MKNRMTYYAAKQHLNRQKSDNINGSKMKMVRAISMLHQRFRMYDLNSTDSYYR